MSTAALNHAASAPSPGKSGSAREVSSYLAGLLLAVVGGALGLAPALFWLGRRSWLPLVAVGVAGLYLFVTRSDRRLRDVFEPPALLFGLGMSAYGSAIAGVLALLLYLAGWLLGAAMTWVWSLFAAAPDWLHRIASVSSVVGLVIGLPLIAVSTPELARWLRRSSAERAQAVGTAQGGRTQKMASLWVAAALMAAAGFAYARGMGGKHWILLQVALLFASTEAWTIVLAAAASGRGKSAVDRVQSLLEDAGFEVERSVAGASPDAAPLLRKIDLVAQRGGGYVAVAVNAGDGSRPIEPSAASALSIAASALAVEKDLDLAAVRPLLVLAGADAEPGLEHVARRERVGLLTLSSADLQEIERGAGSATGVRLEQALASSGAAAS